ncbi:MAG: hypothetical protein ABSC93_31235, partial [Bryobacteraceae bacterium]|jgi:hypothetical protein
MNTRAIRTTLSGKHLSVSLVLFFAFAVLGAAASKTSAPSKPAPAPKSSGSAAKPASGASASHGTTTTTSHGPTTSGGGATTASHGATTTSHGATTTTSHGATTTTSHGATTASHGTTTAGHTTTTAGHTTGAATGKTGGAATAGKGGTGSTSGKTFGRTASPAPKGSKTVATSHGSVTKRADGHVSTIHDTKRGMDVHHNLSGNRRVVVERSDHSRIVAERGGRGYVQRPYSYHGHEYARRSYYYHGRYYHGYYGRYYYHGYYVNPYYPAAYWGPAYYGWAYYPWARPVPYGWGWGGNPWFGYYGAFFTPYPVYASPSLWLTDYIIANSLQAAYVAQAAALSNPAPLTPEVKDLIAEEVKEQVALENKESAAAAAPNGEPDAKTSSIAQLLGDGKPHVFVAGHDLDVVDAGGNECALSEGDAMQLTGQTAPDAANATLAVLASKGGKECVKGDTVSVPLDELQEMQNHMRETIDQGLAELHKKAGQGGLPAAPAAAKADAVESPMAAIAPPPPPESEVKAEINQQSTEADKAEKEATADSAASGPGPNAGDTAGPPPAIEVGQTIDEVTAAMGAPVKTVNLGAKKIYIYKDMKITFKDGKVADVQ